MKPVTITRTRGVCGGRPCFSGTRLEPHVFWSFFEAGYSVPEILKQYPTMTRAHVAMSRQLWQAARWHFSDGQRKRAAAELRKAATWARPHREDESYAGAEIAFALERRADQLDAGGDS